MVDSRLDGSGSSACVDDATIAAFVDGTLDSESRQRVVAHIASCHDCYELVTEVVRAEDELAEAVEKDGSRRPDVDDPKAEPPQNLLKFRRRGLAAAGGVVAIAASVLLIVLNRGNQLGPLVEVVGNERLTLARPTGDFHYGPLRSPLRGTRETENLQLAAEAARLRERAERTQAAADLHASGVAQLLAGDPAAGVTLLESAAQAQPRDAAFRADVGAAYMMRFLEGGNQSDAAAALDALDKALALSPAVKEAWFNKALLLQQLERHTEAIAAWDTYLQLPAEVGWRDEAIRSRDTAQRQLSGR